MKALFLSIVIAAGAAILTDGAPGTHTQQVMSGKPPQGPATSLR